MLWIGLTGGIASGKSTFCKILEKHNVPIVYADRLAHECLIPDSSIFAEVVKFFGLNILNSQEEIDRKKLGTIVFSDPQKMNWLEKKIHPIVQLKVLKQRQKLKELGASFAIYEVPLLFEKKMEPMFDRVVVIVSSKERQMKRLVEIRGFSNEEATQRIQSQISNEKKKELGDYVVENNGSLEKLESLATQFLRDVKQW